MDDPDAPLLVPDMALASAAFQAAAHDFTAQCAAAASTVDAWHHALAAMDTAWRITAVAWAAIDGQPVPDAFRPALTALAGQHEQWAATLRQILTTPPRRSRRAARTPPNPAALALTRRHADGYQERVGQPLTVAWARDVQIYKDLLRLYDAALLERCQDRFFSLPADHWAAQHGWTVPAFKSVLPTLLADLQSWDRLNADQTAAAQALMGEGVGEATALAVAAAEDAAVIHRYVAAHRQRRAAGACVSSSGLVRAIRERQPIAPADLPLPLHPALRNTANDDDSPDDHDIMGDLRQVLAPKVSHAAPPGQGGAPRARRSIHIGQDG